jgi:hypothetical protein
VSEHCRGSFAEPLIPRTLIFESKTQRQLAVIEGHLWPSPHSTIELPEPWPRDARVLGSRLLIDPKGVSPKYATVLVDVEFLEGHVGRPAGD